MIVTRLAWVAGICVLGGLCALGAMGFTSAMPLLVTGVVLVIMIGGGNVLFGRGGRSPYVPPGQSDDSEEAS